DVLSELSPIADEVDEIVVDTVFAENLRLADALGIFFVRVEKIAYGAGCRWVERVAALRAQSDLDARGAVARQLVEHLAESTLRFLVPFGEVREVDDADRFHLPSALDRVRAKARDHRERRVRHRSKIVTEEDPTDDFS